jgi:tetratricopeptide (TPR) repeat protein
MRFSQWRRLRSCITIAALNVCLVPAYVSAADSTTNTNPLLKPQFPDTPIATSPPKVGPDAPNAPSLKQSNGKPGAAVTIGDTPGDASPNDEIQLTGGEYEVNSNGGNARSPRLLDTSDHKNGKSLSFNRVDPSIEEDTSFVTQTAGTEAAEIRLGTPKSLAKKRIDDLESMKYVEPDAATLSGVQAGVTTIEDTIKHFGDPRESNIADGAGTAKFNFPPFEYLELTAKDNRVDSMMIQIPDGVLLDEGTKQLGLGDISSVKVLDDKGQQIGVAFPERGVLFSLDSTGKKIMQIMLEPLSAESFLLRAEDRMIASPRSALLDVELAHLVQPNNAPAYELQARILMSLGHWTEAKSTIRSAIKIDAENPAYQLTLAECLQMSGDHAGSQRLVTEILASHKNGEKKLPTELHAKAECLHGDTLASGSRRDYAKAIEHHLAALKLADSLKDSSDFRVRRAAKRTFMHANLGIADDIAWGNWQQKEIAVPKWIERGRLAAEDLIRTESADPELRLTVARSALAAIAGTQGKIDGTEWSKTALDAAKEVMTPTADPWRRQRIEWQLGLILYDGLQVDQARGLKGFTLANSATVVQYLESGAQFREQTAVDVFLLGRLYYRVGAVFAIEKQDHRTAAYWYDKALPLLSRPIPDATPSDWARQGETMVSMGLSFWEVGRRPEGVKLSEIGVDWMIKAVQAKGLSEKALAIPYANLANMHKSLGNTDESKSYLDLAGKIDSTDATRRR